MPHQDDQGGALCSPIAWMATRTVQPRTFTRSGPHLRVIRASRSPTPREREMQTTRSPRCCVSLSAMPTPTIDRILAYEAMQPGHTAHARIGSRVDQIALFRDAPGAS